MKYDLKQGLIPETGPNMASLKGQTNYLSFKIHTHNSQQPTLIEHATPT